MRNAQGKMRENVIKILICRKKMAKMSWEVQECSLCPFIHRVVYSDGNF